MAIVYLARDLKHERQVAVKVLDPELAAAVGHDRFLHEIRTTANLRHPHIIPLYDSGDSGDHLFYVMPFIEGDSLRSRLRREVQLSIDETLRIIGEVANALAFAHAQGVVHRDIKPENILLDAGHAVVSDFGLASALTVAGGERLTRTGVILGTPAYMSPEQASGAREVDARSDLYSLACVAYEMFAGQPPFTAPTPAVVLARHLVDPVPPLGTARPGLAPHIVQAVESALAKTPVDRLDDVAAWATALAATPDATSITIPPAAESVPGVARAPELTRTAESRSTPTPSRERASRSIAVLPLETPGSTGRDGVRRGHPRRDPHTARRHRRSPRHRAHVRASVPEQRETDVEDRR